MGRLRDAWDALSGRTGKPGKPLALSEKETWDLIVQASKVYPRLRSWPDPARAGTKDILDHYSTHAWLRAIAEKVATDVARTPLVLYRRKTGGARGLRRSELRRAAAMGDLEPIDEHPILDLLARPNPIMSGFTTRKMTQLGLDLTGEGFWIKERNLLAQPVQYWFAPSYWCTQLPTAATRQFRFVFRSWVTSLDPSEVIWFANADPSNPYGRGTGLGMAMSQEFDADDYAASMISAKFANRMLPEAFLTLGSDANPSTPEEAKELEARLRQLHGGPDNYGGVHVGNKELSVETIDANFSDNQLAELRAYLRDTCIQLWGVPPEIFGIIENSNRATIDAADYLYAKRCQVPRLDILTDMLQEQVVREFDDGLELGYESPVPEDQEFALKVFTAGAPAFRVDDWRKLSNLPPLGPGSGGDLHIIPSTVSELTDDLSSVEKAPPPAVAPPLPGKGKLPPDAEPRWARSLAHEHRVRVAQDVGTRRLRADVVAPRLRAQRDRVAAAVANGARSQGDEKDLDQAVTSDQDAWADTYAEHAAREVAVGAMIGAADVPHETIMATDPAILEYAAAAAARYVTRVDQTTIERIREIVLAGLDAGDPVASIAGDIRAEFDGWIGEDGGDIDRTRATAIARTEVVAAQNYGIQLGLERLSGVKAKAWMTMGDAYVRDSHAALDGEEQPLEGSFSNGLRWPGDLEQGDPAETVNCRCTLKPVWEQ